MRNPTAISCRLAACVLLFPLALAAQVWEVDEVCVELPEPQGDAGFGYSLVIGEFDGDGVNDLAVGALGWDSSTIAEAGSWMVFRGSTARTLSPVGGVFSFGSVGPFGAGTALAAGDFDGDGRDEIAVGAPLTGVGEADNAGIVVISKYDADLDVWPPPSLALSQEDVPQGVPETYDLFGQELAVGDFDGDGRDDLAVAAPLDRWPGYPDGWGVVHVFRGDADQILRTDDSINLVPASLLSAGAFGSSLATGDFDGDGYDDLAVGAPERTIGSATQAGAVEIFYGSTAGLSSSSAQVIDDGAFPAGVVAAWNWFGRSLAVGDFDEGPAECGMVAPCFDDLAIGVPGEDSSGQETVGKVILAFGGGSGLSTTPFTTIRPSSIGVAESGLARFGLVLAAGRIDPDPARSAVLAVGMPYDDWGDDQDGVVHLVFLGEPEVGGELPHQHLVQQTGLGVAPPGAEEEFGWRLAIGDLDDDGWGDLVVGAPGNGTVHSGAAQLLYGALFADGFERGNDDGW